MGAVRVPALPKLPLSWIMAGGAVLAALAVVAIKGASGTGEAIGRGAVDVVDGVLTGAVTGIGERVGIPQTSMTECERAKAEGRSWDASFACPAGDFLRYLVN